MGDVMLRHPKTLTGEASLEQARAALSNDHVHMVLLADQDKLLGTLVRADLPPSTVEGRALPWATLEGRTVSAFAPAEAVRATLVETGIRRLAVTDSEGKLLGLMCLKRRLTGFCSDSEVASRRGESAPAHVS